MDVSLFLKLIEEISESPAGSLTLEIPLADIGWDSLCVLGLISEFDKSHGKSLPAEKVAMAVTVEDLFVLATDS